jgi:hypothetical protein
MHLRKLEEADARSAKVTNAARAEQEARARERIAKQEAEQEAREKEAREKEERKKEEHQAQASQHTMSEEADAPPNTPQPSNAPSSSHHHPHKPSTRDLAKTKQRRIHIARIWAQEMHISRAAESLASTGSVADPAGEYVDLDWDKKDGTSVCDFCDKTVKLYAFVCPLAYAVACEACVMGLSFCAKEMVGGGKRDDGEEGKWEKVGRKKGKGKRKK